MYKGRMHKKWDKGHVFGYLCSYFGGFPQLISLLKRDGINFNE